MVKVLFDHNMPPALARALNEIVKSEGHEAYALRDKFDIRVSDVEYLETLGKEGNWVVISKDRQNARRKPERAAILKHGVVAIYLAKSVERQRLTEQAASILWQWDRIVAQRENNRNGLFTLPVGKKSKFESL